MELRLKLSADDQEVEVRRFINGAASPSLQVYIDCKDASRGTTTLSQELLQDIIKVSPTVFLNTVIFGGKASSFAYGTDATQKPILNKILGLDDWEIYQDKAKKIRTNHLYKRQELIGQRGSAEQRIKLLEGDIENYKEDYVKAVGDVPVDKFDERFTSLKEEYDRERKRLVKMEAKVSEESVRNEVAETNKTTLSHFKGVLKEELSRCELLSKEIHELNKGKAKAQSGVCPTCGQTVKDSGKMDSYLKKLAAKVDIFQKTEKRKDESSRKVADLESSLDGYDFGKFISMQAALDKQRKRVSILSNTVNDRIAAKAEHDIKVAEANQRVKEINRAIDKARKDKKAEELSIQEIGRKMSYQDKMLTCCDNAIEMFSRQGIQSQLIGDFEEVLNLGIGKYFSAFNFKSVKLSLSTQKKNRNGEFRDKIDLKLVNKDGKKRSFSSFSPGECKRIELAIFLALREAGEAEVEINLMLIDEALDKGDEDLLFSLMEIIDDHFPYKWKYLTSPRLVQGMVFSRSITAVKSKGISRLVE